MEGFLGTKASLLPDLSLVLTLDLFAVALAGWLLARRRAFPVHCRIMAIAALVNWIPVLIVMVPAWAGLLTGATDLTGGRRFVPLGHGLAGGGAQLLMTYTAVRMQWLKQLPPRRPRWLMVATLVFWGLAAIGGMGVYLLLYIR